MTIDGLQTIVVTDNHVLAISVRLVADDAYLTGKGCTDGIADIDLDVQALVLASPAGTEVRGYYATRSRHVETTQVNAELLREDAANFADVSIVPVLIKVSARELSAFCLK